MNKKQMQEEINTLTRQRRIAINCLEEIQTVTGKHILEQKTTNKAWVLQTVTEAITKAKL